MVIMHYNNIPIVNDSKTTKGMKNVKSMSNTKQIEIWLPLVKSWWIFQNKPLTFQKYFYLPVLEENIIVIKCTN